MSAHVKPHLYLGVSRSLRLTFHGEENKRSLKPPYPEGRLIRMNIIPTSKEAEIRRIMVQSQSGQIVLETLSQKHLTKKAGGVAQVSSRVPA
jgi:hypothetical protein